MRSKNYIDIPKHSQNQMRIKQVLNIIGPKSIQNNLVQVQIITFDSRFVIIIITLLEHQGDAAFMYFMC